MRGDSATLRNRRLRISPRLSSDNCATTVARPPSKFESKRQFYICILISTFTASLRNHRGLAQSISIIPLLFYFCVLGYSLQSCYFLAPKADELSTNLLTTGRCAN